MRMLFLDIDGVLNSDAFSSARGPKPEEPEAVDAWHIDPKAVRLLNAVLDETGAVAVLSSDWRKEPDKPGLARTEAALRMRGATFQLIDATPVLTPEERLVRFGSTWKGNYTPRGFEIQCWLDRQALVERFAIVDDEPDMEHLADSLVLTDASVGLTAENCRSLLRLLSD